MYDFRGDLIKEIMPKDYEVMVTESNKKYLDRIKELGRKYKKNPFRNNQIDILEDIKYIFISIDLKKRKSRHYTQLMKLRNVRDLSDYRKYLNFRFNNIFVYYKTQLVKMDGKVYPIVSLILGG